MISISKSMDKRPFPCYSFALADSDQFDERIALDERY